MKIKIVRALSRKSDAKAPEDWNEFADWCRKKSSEANRIRGISFSYDFVDELYIEIRAGVGGSLRERKYTIEAIEDLKKQLAWADKTTSECRKLFPNARIDW